jgi:uncharacterized phage-associated protein
MGMSRRVYQASDVAKFMLAMTDPESNDVSNLKLQKLCYYAQGLVSAMRNCSLFADRLEAWDHGPVVPSLYHEYKIYGSSPIPVVQDFDSSIFEEQDNRALRDIYEHYAQFAAWRLRNMTHDERPWVDAYNSSNRMIPVDSLVSFFRPMIDDDYVKEVYGSSDGEKRA